MFPRRPLRRGFMSMAKPPFRGSRLLQWRNPCSGGGANGPAVRAEMSPGLLVAEQGPLSCETGFLMPQWLGFRRRCPRWKRRGGGPGGPLLLAVVWSSRRAIVIVRPRRFSLLGAGRSAALCRLWSVGQAGASFVLPDGKGVVLKDRIVGHGRVPFLGDLTG